MQINKIRIKRYRRIKEGSLVFDRGLNVILGNNEAGKSTLSSALLDVLFLNPSTKTKDVRALLSWDQKELGTLELDFEIEKEEHKLFKDFENGVVKLTNHEGRVLFEDQKKLGQFFKKVTGISSSGMYMNTAHIAQDDVARIKSDSDLLDAVQSVASESEGSISLKKITRQVEAKIRQIEKGRGKLTVNKGILAELDERLARVDSLLVQKKTEGGIRQQKISQLEEIEEKLKVLEPETQRLDELVSFNEELLGAKEDYKRLDEELDQIERRLQGLSLLKVDESKMIDVEKANKDLALLYTGSKGFEFTQLKFPLLLFGAILFIFGIALEHYLLLFLGALSIVIGIISTFGKVKKGGDAKTILKKWGCSNTDELEDLIAQANQISQNISERKGILMGDTEGSLKEKRKELYKKMSSVEMKYFTPKFMKLELGSEDYYTKLKEVEENKREIEGLRSRKVELKAVLSSGQEDKVNIEDLKVEREEIEEEIKYWEKRNDVLKIVLEGMQYALAKTAENFKDKSSKFITSTLYKLTSGRYSKVKIKEDLAIQVYSDEKGDWIENINELSKGTVDQIFFVIRLAFFKMIHKQEYMPLILDDPFTGYDEDRLKATKILLSELAEEMQILLFTHNPNYRNWGNCVELS